jgi:photoactive yellow protein
MSFVPQNVINGLGNTHPDDFDHFDFGVVKLDSTGSVLVYNKWESDMAGVPKFSAVGKNFFTQVAPCTNNRLFAGRFKDGVAKGEMDTEFNYTFTYKMKPTNVVIRLYKDDTGNYVFVSKKA